MKVAAEDETYIQAISEASVRIAQAPSTRTWLNAIAARSPMAFITSTCLCNNKPPFLYTSACSRLTEAPHPSD